MSLENLDEMQISSLTTALEQRNGRRKSYVSQLDTRIAELTTVPAELEEVIFEGEEFQDTLLEKIRHVEKFLEKQDPQTVQPVAPPTLSASSTTQTTVSTSSNSAQNVLHPESLHSLIICQM